MAKALVLWPAVAAIRIGSAEAAQLGALGVTNVTLLRDDVSIAVMLEGWAFDPNRSALTAAASLGNASECRVLQPTLDVVVSKVEGIGGIDEQTLAHSGGNARGSRAADG